MYETCHCGEIATKGDLCYKHYLKTVGFNYGHLRNRLYPGLTNSETERRQKEDAAKIGETIERPDWL